MINPSNRIATELTQALTNAKKEYSKTVYTGSMYENAPTKFPYVSIVMTDSYTYRRAQTNSLTEKAAVVSFTVNVYTNDSKVQADELVEIVDDKMLSLNFTREALTPVPNLENNKIYRVTSRYTAIAEVDSDNNFIFYRR